MRYSSFLSGCLAWCMVLSVASSAWPEKPKRAVVVTPPPVAAGSLPITGDYWALIIGIDQYQHAPKLESAVKDAKGVRDVLIERYGFKKERITELFNEQATGPRIQNALYQLGRQAGKDDSVFIYYAGHGQYDEDGRLGWWVPVEAQPKDPGTFIMDTSVLSFVKGMKAKHVYLVADSCFSGTLFGTRALPPLNDQFYARLYAHPSRWGLTSGGTEPVADQGKNGHSIFAYHFINLLKENSDPYLVPSHIYDQLAPLVANNTDQTPRSEPLKGAGDEGGQFVFRLASVSGGPLPPARPSAPTLGAPPPKDVDVSGYNDLEAVARLADKREEAWGKVQAFAGKTGVAKEKRLAALDKFRSDFADDNPHIGEVEALKQEIEAEIQVAKAPAYEAPKQAGREVEGKDGANMLLIPAGEFMMGSTEGDADEKPVHRVSLDAFYLDKYEVTNKLFQAFARATGYETTAEKEGKAYGYTSEGKWQEISGANWRKPEGGETVFVSNRDAHPVVSVSWHDAEAYCRWASKRLPTEAEFEYANRAGTQTTYWWGDGNPGSRRVANIADESGKRQFSGWAVMTGYDDGYVRTAPVGSFEPNAFGLYDTTGNVWEWTADWYGDTYYQNSPSRNPTGAASGQYRVLRGGSWSGVPRSVRSADRYGHTPSLRYANLGFRCAKTP